MPLAGHGGKGVCTPSVCTVRLWDHEGTCDMPRSTMPRMVRRTVTGFRKYYGFTLPFRCALARSTGTCFVFVAGPYCCSYTSCCTELHLCRLARAGTTGTYHTVNVWLLFTVSVDRRELSTTVGMYQHSAYGLRLSVESTGSVECCILETPLSARVASVRKG